MRIVIATMYFSASGFLALAVALAYLQLCSSFAFHKLPSLLTRPRYSPSSLPLIKLDTGDFEGVSFVQLNDDNGIGKFNIDASISSAELNDILDEYKAEMKRRKVVFPGIYM